MKRTIKILHLDDLHSDSALIDIELNKAGIQFEHMVVDTREEFMSALEDFQPDIILADDSLSSLNSIEALQLVREHNVNVPLLLVTAAISDEHINIIMKAGATGYILKNNLNELPSEIKKALDKIFLEGKGYPEVEVVAEEKLYDLKMLEEMDDYDYLAEIVSIFLEETPRELKDMQQAARSGKSTLLSEKAHKLKSSSGLLEANKLTGILLQIEEGAKSGAGTDRLTALVESATSEYKKIEASLKVHLRTIAH